MPGPVVTLAEGAAHEAPHAHLAPRPIPEPTGRRVRVVSMRLEDRSGVMQRVTNCIQRRGFRLETCAVGPTPEPGIAGLTLRVDPGYQPPDQVVKQLAKLIDVVSVEDITDTPRVEWTTALVTIDRRGAEAIVDPAVARLDGQILHRDADRVVVAVAGPPAELATRLEALRPLPGADWVCSGPLACAPGQPVTMAGTAASAPPTTQQRGQ